ncbi:MAG TPA: hypothetical protein VKT29_05370 [Terriglobales bacterium]|nr:hypothetical protein [Terriglobales bacterium]
MRILRFLALAGMFTMVLPLASLASTKNSTEQKKNISLLDTVELAGKTLSPGQYKVEWNGTGPMVHVKFLKNGKTVLTAPAEVAQLQQKAPYSAVVENTKKNGTKTLREIEWNNQREALIFGPQARSGHAHHTRASAS